MASLSDEGRPERSTEYHMQMAEADRGPHTPEGYQPITQHTSRGTIDMRYYAPAPAQAGRARRGAICVGGAGGGFDTPVRGWLYPRLCQDLATGGIAALRVRYRYANNLAESVLDVLAGLLFLETEGITTVGLVGHSFGGAVVIQAAALSDRVRTCVALSTQTYGADAAAELGPRCSLLLAHGLGDEILPAQCSRYVHKIARQPKQLLLKAGVHHGLDEWSDELPGILEDWLRTELAKP